MVKKKMNTTVILQNEIAEVQRLKDTLIECGKDHHISDEVIQEVNLALEEAVSNIIFYGYEDAEEHQIEVQIDLQDDLLVLELRDDAKPFNLLDAPDPDLEASFDDREIGGMGIHLVRTLMDELDYRREQGKNVLLMKKHIPVSPPVDQNSPLKS